MTATHLPRRAVVGAVLASALLGTGLAAFADDAAVGCPATYTDPAGDAAFQDPATAPATGDDDLDIVAVTHSVDAGMFSTAVKVVALNAGGPANAFADRFITAFTVAGKAVTVTAERDFSGFGTNKASATVAGTAVTFPVKLVENVKGNTISAVMSAADLEKAVGAPLAGQAFSAMSSTARAVYPSNASPGTAQPAWDTATAPSTASYSFGSGCGGAAPAPVPSDTPAPVDPAPAPPAAGGGDPSTLPVADCFLAKDPKGDAHVLNANTPNDPDLDLTALTLGADAKNLYAYLKVDKLGAGPAYHEGHRFYVNFTHNKHNFTMAGSTYKDANSAQLKDGLAQSGQVAHVTQLAVDGVSSATDPARFTGAGTGFVASGLKFVFDQKTNTVTAILPVADIEKYGKAPVAGAVFTGVYGSTSGDAYAVGQPADAVPDGASSPTTSKVTYAAGDNHCFGGTAASSGPLSSVGAVTAQYGDTAAVAAKLLDSSGAPAAGKTVTFTLGASKATGTTGADGVAKAALPVTEKAGKRTMTLTADTATASVPFTVLLEKTSLKATGSKGTVTATLSDDDRHAVAGQLVTFASGSKKVTAKTDAKGVAKAKGLPSGSVKVTYAGVSGMYAGTSTSTKA